MDINKALIQKLHDEYLEIAREQISHSKDYREMMRKQKSEIHISNARFHQGKASSLYRVINDLRHILKLPMLEELSENHRDFGHVFNQE